MGNTPAPKRGGRGACLPKLQMDMLRVEKDRPVPALAGGRSLKGSTRYDLVFDQLTADGMSVTGIPRVYYNAIGKAAPRATAPDDYGRI